MRLFAAACLSLMLAAASAETPLRTAIETQLRIGFDTSFAEEGNATLPLVHSVYTEAGYTPLWIGEDGDISRAGGLAEALRQLRNDGLEPSDYDTAVIGRLLADIRSNGRTARQLAELEVRLSVALVQAASDLASGRLEPRQVNPAVYVYPQDVDQADVLRRARHAADAGQFLHGFRPAQANYHRLKAALVRYRALAAAGEPRALPPGETLATGMVGPRVALLRKRLALLGDLPASEEDVAEKFDLALAGAVRRFQYRHGLEQDGLVGKKTLAALNVSLRTRVDQILLNMERRRWMPDKFEARYVFVNLADFFLKVVDTRRGEEQTIHTAYVVVGKPYHQTPEFSDQIRYLVINPYWNVPVSITKNEILPRIKHDPTYLQQRNFELLSGWSNSATVVDSASIDWASITAREFNYRLRQGPGSENALGRIKFMFPNRHHIYLHDTPAKALFRKSSRAFSHGCIRVQDANRLATVLLSWQEGWPRERIEEAIETGARTVVPLAKPVPVHLAYISAWVNKDDTVHFRHDIYGRDEMLARALLSRPLDLQP